MNLSGAGKGVWQAVPLASLPPCLSRELQGKKAWEEGRMRGKVACVRACCKKPGREGKQRNKPQSWKCHVSTTTTELAVEEVFIV